MKLHANAKLCPSSRVLLVRRVLEESWTVAQAAVAQGVSERTVYRWLARWRAGDHQLMDRSSRPHTIPRRTPAATVRVIEQLRRLRMTSSAIAAKLSMAVSTVGVVLVRLGLNRLSRLEPPEPPNRYQRRHPGELVHLDVKKLRRFARPGHRVTGRGPGTDTHTNAGWEAVHVAIDDCSRLAYVEVLTDERAATTVAFLERSLAWFAERGITVQRVMSDNGANYCSRHFAATCQRHHIRHVRTRPYRPRTNGKAERFIQTLLREWAYAAAYQSSDHRALALTTWLDYYNQRRPHGALSHQPPASRLTAA